jgi:hypothetical protein
MDTTLSPPIERPRISIPLLRSWHRPVNGGRWWYIERVTKAHITGYVAATRTLPSWGDARPFTINRRAGGDLVWPRTIAIGTSAYDFLTDLTMRIECGRKRVRR